MYKTKEFNDEDLISLTYDVAGQHLRKRINDWNNTGHWRKIVFELPKHVQITYMIGILNMQVMNGGFIQYYDNNYGIFALETLYGLKTIKAELTYDLLKQSIKILEKFKNSDTELVNFIKENGYREIHEIESTFDELDDNYYKLDEQENLTELLANYLREIKIKTGYNNGEHAGPL